MTLGTKNWKEVGFGGGETTDLKKSAIGTTLEGIYLGFREIVTDYGPNKVYSFEGPSGEFSVYGFTDLDTKISQIKTGDEVRLQYEGREAVKTKRGIVQMHRVKVEVASL
jgi:hypothetical protein